MYRNVRRYDSAAKTIRTNAYTFTQNSNFVRTQPTNVKLNGDLKTNIANIFVKFHAKISLVKTG